MSFLRHLSLFGLLSRCRSKTSLPDKLDNYSNHVLIRHKFQQLAGKTKLLHLITKSKKVFLLNKKKEFFSKKSFGECYSKGLKGKNSTQTLRTTKLPAY